MFFKKPIKILIGGEAAKLGYITYLALVVRGQQQLCIRKAAGLNKGFRCGTDCSLKISIKL